MTEQEAITILESGVPSAFQANRSALAKAHLAKAVSKAGRISGVDFNMEKIEITLTSGKSEYRMGQDIAVQTPAFWNIREMYRTDVPNWKVSVVGLEDFNAHARGSTVSAPPQLATMHSARNVFEVWPKPDAAYTLWSYVRVGVSSFAKIPQQYRDIVVDMAMLSMKAAFDPGVAARLAKEGFRELTAETLTQSNPDFVSAVHPLGTTNKDDNISVRKLR